MTLDVHLYENGRIGQFLFQIDDKIYGDLYPSFRLFQQRTGLLIDPYRDLVVDIALPALILALTEGHVSLALRGILEKCERMGQSVIFVGD
ncbi:hypothetical protein [Hyphomonas pacifica]|uniref:Uncharacterized protein n=1 Tax=Hyphomonas pacifica TaxID=1280941 RepID=A0A062TVD1_9PROT|nr:hypothetical protein [Hyphomonas pacifica]KCZ49265.1 hypothetical protein HY2_15325 [Hyphomonas pacifica]RAN31902.1 hypothetical protein HY3_16110 [Hyphomonas pacifica]